MRKFLCILVLLVTNISVSASEVTEYLEAISSIKYGKPVKVVSKMEHIEKYEQKIGEEIFPFIVYGFGYIKVKKIKKQTISYIGLLDKNCKPVWAYVIPR